MNPEQELQELDKAWTQNRELHESARRLNVSGTKAWFGMMGGFGLVVLGLWMDQLGEDARLERMLWPWPVVCIVIGIFGVFVSLGIMIYTGRRLRAYNEKAVEYEIRRAELLREIHGPPE